MNTKTMPPAEPTEDQEQASLFSWATLMAIKYPELKYMFAIPNGGARHIVVAKRLKATGVKAGVPDIFLPVPKGKYHGLFIELKRSSKGTLSDSQTEWLEGLEAQGYCTALCYGQELASELIIEYLLLKEGETLVE